MFIITYMVKDFIIEIEEKRLALKRKLDLVFYISLCLYGVAIILLIIYFCFITDSNAKYLLIFFFVLLIFGGGLYAGFYYFFNKKYLSIFGDSLTDESLKFHYRNKYKFDKNVGVSKDIMDKSLVLATSSEFSSSKGLYVETDNYNFISSAYTIKYKKISNNINDKSGIKNQVYKGRFIRYEVKNNNNIFLSLISNSFPSDMINDPRIGEKLTFEYKEFNNEFSVKSSSPIRCKQIITPQVQLDLLNLKYGFKTEFVVVLLDNYVYVFMNEYKLYEDLNIYKKFDQKVFKSYSNEYYLPILIAEALNLDDRKFSN